MAYLLDWSLTRSLSQPIKVPRIVSQPVVVQPIVGQPSVGQPSADQPGGPILPLLSLQLQPDLNVLAPGPSLPKLSGMSTLASRSAEPYQIKL